MKMEYSLSNHDIIKFLKDRKIDCYIMPYPQLKKYKNIENLFKNRGKCIVINFLHKNADGTYNKNYGHWTALFKRDDNNIEYFDSYGKLPDTWKQEYPYLSRLLLDFMDNGGKVFFNDHQFQEFKKGINTCGKHVIARLLFKEMPLKQYINLFKNSRGVTSDELVDYIYNNARKKY